MQQDKKRQLEKIAEEIRSCTVCPIGKSGVPVVGEGNADADIVFIGEAPGKQEALSGRPFIGRSGKLLRGLIKEVGLRDEDIFITSPVKYLPNRGTPTTSDIVHGMIHTSKQLDIIDPKFIVLMGNSAVQGILGEKLPIMKVHGTVIEREGKKYFITLHPAAGLRFPIFKKLLLEDFTLLKTLLQSN